MASSAVPGKTVLIADDTPFVRERFMTALEGAGHRAMFARSAAELLARVRADIDQIDLLLVDLKLPHQSGANLIRAVRKLDGGRLPILVFSGTVSSAEEVRELAALGVSGYINEYSAAQHILPSLAPHLFPDNFNRRVSKRLVLGIPIAYRAGGTIAAALTLNINRGGMAIRTTSPLERDTEVKLRFRLPGSKKDIDLEARVCWSDSNSGMGLAFTRVDAADQSAIDDFVDAHFADEPAPEDAPVPDTPTEPTA
ncbi:MAG: response regulator [Vicinamibacterales bacterium]